jgi:hypothetical protein
MSLGIHASNAWNPTGRNLLPVAGTRLFYTHVTTLSGERTQVFLGDQRHLVYVADVEGSLPEAAIEEVAGSMRVYPHQVRA